MVTKVNIGMIGAFDTKGADYTYLRQQLICYNCKVIAIHVGVFPADVLFPLDIDCKELIEPKDIEELRQRKERPYAVAIITDSLKAKIDSIRSRFNIHGFIGMGGTNGTAILTSAMQQLPRKMPKICISTVAQHENWEYTKAANIMLIDSCVDVGGLNSISMQKYRSAATIVWSLAKDILDSGPGLELQPSRHAIGISMFGNTTRCVNRCSAALQNQYEIMPFHAVGTGGKNLEALVKDGTIRGGVLDITLQEIAALIGKGIFCAGPERLNAPGDTQTPHLVIPGCVDMIMLGNMAEAQEKFPGRKFYKCTDKSTAMRTTKEENEKIGKFIAEKMNAARLKRTPVAILVPGKALSMFDEKRESGMMLLLIMHSLKL